MSANTYTQHFKSSLEAITEAVEELGPWVSISYPIPLISPQCPHLPLFYPALNTSNVSYVYPSCWPSSHKTVFEAPKGKQFR